LSGEIEHARVAAEASLSVEGVHSLGSGLYAEAATYEGTGKFVGVVVGSQDIRVHIVVCYPLASSLPELTDEVREKIMKATDAERVEVVVEDLKSDEDL